MIEWESNSDIIKNPLSADEYVARHLYNQGFRTKEDMVRLTDGYLPHGLDNEGKLFALIDEAIAEKANIEIFGDYDTDGVMASTIMFRFLASLGCVAKVRLPDRRTNGFGLSRTMVEAAVKDGTEIIITVDNGTAAKDAVDCASEHGIKVFVTDHHQMTPGTYPDKAVGVINPTIGNSDKKFKGICGAVVALLIAEDYYASKSLSAPELFEELRESAAIATVADVMPLWYGNRKLVNDLVDKIRLGSLKNKAIIALLDVSGVKCAYADSSTIGFKIAPEINAPGRLFPHGADYPAKLFMAKTDNGRKCFAEFCDAANRERKDCTEEMLYSVSMLEPESVQVVLYHGANEGIVGIIAGRITEATGKPSFVFTEGENGVCKGSGRSPINYNLIEGAKRVFAKHPELGTHFGGHAGAMGLTLANPDAVATFEKGMIEDYDSQDVAPIVQVYIPYDPRERTLGEIYEAFEPIRPFGEGNEEPVFKITGKAVNVCCFGRACTFSVVSEGGTINLSWFRGTVEEGKTYDFYFNVSKDFAKNAVSYGGFATYVEEIAEAEGQASPSDSFIPF
jgi:single-stranded-DNA-specific exonuclease